MQRQGSAGEEGLPAGDPLDPAVRFPSDGLTEGFFFFFPMQSSWSLRVRSMRAVKEHQLREQRLTRPETEKLEFFVAEAS